MAAITNAQVKQSVDDLIHRFDLFEQKEESRHAQIERDIKEFDREIFGNGKEGLKSMVKTLWDKYHKDEKRTDAIWIGIVMIFITQVLSLVLK